MILLSCRLMKSLRLQCIAMYTVHSGSTFQCTHVIMFPRVDNQLNLEDCVNVKHKQDIE